MTPERRKRRLAHFRAYDKIYDADRRERRRLSDTARYFAKHELRLAQAKAYYRRNRAAILRRKSPTLTAEDMIAEALA